MEVKLKSIINYKLYVIEYSQFKKNPNSYLKKYNLNENVFANSEN